MQDANEDTEQQDHLAIEFALANRTGSGFAGDFGYLSVDELAREAELPVGKAQAILNGMFIAGEALMNEVGNYSGLPAQCVVCCDDPCTCGLGSWR